jgi:hypothetical protein
MATQTVTVQFHDQSLTAAVIDGKPFVAMKPICDNIGLHWEGQRQRITRHPVLNSVTCMTQATGTDGKHYEMLMLPLDYLNGWLFGIDVSRIKEELKPRLIDYQRECFRVLADHFLPQPAAGKRLPAKPEGGCPRYDVPLSLWPIQHKFGTTVLLTYRDFRRFDPADRPLDKLLFKLKRDGHDVAGAAAEYDLLLSVAETMYWQLDTLRSLFAKLEGLGVHVRQA